MEIIRKKIKLGAEQPFTLLHLTDLHLLYCDERDGEYENENALERVTHYFNYTDKAHEEVIAYIRENKPQVVLMTGDIVDFPSAANLDALNVLKSLIESYGGVCIYTPGNHDWSYPRNYHKKETYEKYMPLFNDVCGGNTDIGITEYNGIRFVTVDDSREKISDEQLAAFEKAVDCGKPTVAVMHVPITAEKLKEKTDAVWHARVLIGVNESSENTKKLCSVAAEKCSAVMAGHIHFEHEDDIGCGTMQYIAELAAYGKFTVYDIE